MSDMDDLYAELKPAIGALANPLFEMSQKFLRELGNFLPHGAVLTREGEIQLVAADPGGKDGQSTSTEVLPLLHEGLRFHAGDKGAQAIGVAENVTVTLEGSASTQAIKVLFEHERGLTVALYLPFKKRFIRGFAFGETFSMLATPEVCAWRGDAT
jgi:hypothetical protein